MRGRRPTIDELRAKLALVQPTEPSPPSRPVEDLDRLIAEVEAITRASMETERRIEALRWWCS